MAVTESSYPRDTALVVEDSIDNLSMLTTALEEAGMTVLVSVDGDSALKLVEKVRPDIVLMDAIMPGKDGFETTRLLKQVPFMSDVPVIFMTGLTATEHVLKGLQAGGVDYVTKPVVLDELLARIRVHLANARAAHGARVALDASGRFLLAVNAAGDILWLTPQARHILTDSAPGAAASDHCVLPPAVRQWIEEVSGSETALPQLTVGIRGHAIVFSLVARHPQHQFILRLVEERKILPESILKDRLSVTTREAEVLMWLTRGKSNKDIADILGLSPRTVNKHLEQIYTKLGVENRSSAAAIALELLNTGH
ncbi:DNA-binding response regulator [Pseudochelatococcus sp. B33]